VSDVTAEVDVAEVRVLAAFITLALQAGAELASAVRL
jgi:hypothetical protein